MNQYHGTIKKTHGTTKQNLGTKSSHENIRNHGIKNALTYQKRSTENEHKDLGHH